MRRFLTGVLLLALVLVLAGGVVLFLRFESGADTDRAVLEAINRPGGGDYAAAVRDVRRAHEPSAEEAYHVGQLVVGAYDQPVARRPTETLVQGIRLLEQAAASPGEAQGPARQQLRLLFERGLGTPPDAIPIDPAVAACWRALEEGRPGDPARCVDLRRRLPGLSS